MFRFLRLATHDVSLAPRLAVLALVVITATGMRPAPSDIVLSEAEVDAIAAQIQADLQAGNPVTLDWKTMAALNYRTGDMPETLKALNGQEVRIPGFMVPLEDWEEEVTEFILVPYFGACIHVPPPPPNQMAHVLMQRNRRIAVNLWDPVWVIGKLAIENVESPYGVIGYQVSADRIAPYEG
ncbi:MAG TPA: DUF3299 domain-containing protein [Longimicrobiales bacterium]|nr:DUF3299 domain-containing protein [Longimicrobiales bacterium]